MAATTTRIASADFVLAERKCAHDLSLQEFAEMNFPAINHLEWLNCHLSELLASSQFKVLRAFKTPGKLRCAKTPAFKPPSARKTPEKEPEGNTTPTPTPQDAVQLYTDSDISLPSTHATPEQTLRKTSFSYAHLPPRDSIKPSIGQRTTDITDFKPIAHISPSSPVQPARQQSLGLDSDDEVLDDAESVDLRAPELIAHEERMREYESSSPPPATQLVSSKPEIPEPESQTDNIEQLVQPENIIEDTDDASIEVQSPEESATQITLLDTIKEAPEDITEDADNASIEDQAPAESISLTTSDETLKEVPVAASRPSQVRPPTTRRLAAPKTFGRPVRPTNIAKPQPIPIKIKPLSHPKPINPAPVAAHNTTKPQPPPEKPIVFSIAEKKKRLDEEAAAKDARVKQQQKERRDNKLEELKRNKHQEEAAKDEQARRKSAEKRKAHFDDMEYRRKRSNSLEKRQEREEAETAAKKQAFREIQQKRHFKPATMPVAKPTIKPTIKAAAPSGTRSQNPPPRPPARLEHHEPSRPASRLELNNDDMDMPEKDAELPAYPTTLSKPPVRASIKKPSIFTSTSQNTQQQFPQPPSRVAPQMQQYATQRIPFATDMSQQQRNQESIRLQAQYGPSINTPFATMRNIHTIQAINGTSPTDITLPEIHTDSTDESGGNVSLPSWATPGHVFNTLSQQEIVNPDVIFPRIPTISMDDVFAENPDRLRRLRMRTSSANWVRTGDALTQVEVIDDRIGRQAIRNAGGWFFAPYGNQR